MSSQPFRGLTSENEQWRPVVGYERYYEVSDQGRVRSLPRPGTRGGVLRAFRNEAGYLYVSLWRSGSGSRLRVNRLVAQAWHGTPPPGHVARHLDGDQSNNRPANLAWGTHAENIADSVRLGRTAGQKKTHCPAGHEYTAANTYTSRSRSGSGISRKCRECHLARKPKAPPRPDVCKRGHSMADAYVIRGAKTQRRCRPCQLQSKAAYEARKRAARTTTGTVARPGTLGSETYETIVRLMERGVL